MWSYGIDVSNWQGVIDWNTVNDDTNILFVYMLLTDGYWRGRPKGTSLSIANSYDMNRQHCRKFSGPYTFARPHLTPPDDSATFSFQCVNQRHEMPHCLDMENYVGLTMSLNQIVDWTGRWLTRMESLDGRRPIIYSGAFYRGPGIARSFSNYFWWMPGYTGNSKIDPNPLTLDPPKLNGNRSPDMWQYTSTGRINGIVGNVDRNIVLTDKIISIIEIEENMPSLAEVLDAVNSINGSYIIHVNPHTSDRMHYLSSIGVFGPITPETVPDLAFQAFPDFTMVQRTGDEVAALKSVGVKDHGFRDDSWFRFLRLSSRDTA